MASVINIRKKISAEVDSLFKKIDSIAGITYGQKCYLHNRLNAIRQIGRKGQAMIERGISHHAAYDARTPEDFAEQAKRLHGIYLALLGGATVDLTWSDAFETSEFHTCISKIRRKVERHHPDLELCDEWVRPGEGRRPYKKYWIIKKIQETNGII